MRGTRHSVDVEWKPGRRPRYDTPADVLHGRLPLEVLEDPTGRPQSATVPRTLTLSSEEVQDLGLRTSDYCQWTRTAPRRSPVLWLILVLVLVLRLVHRPNRTSQPRQPSLLIASRVRVARGVAPANPHLARVHT